MDLFPLFILALVQGITEFLPISSSGHLILVPYVTGWPDQGPAIDVAVHVGTLLAVITYFRADVLRLVNGGVKILTGKLNDIDARLTLYIGIATIPAVIAGIILHSLGAMDAMRTITLIGWTTLIFGALLWVVDVRAANNDTVEAKGWRAVIGIGLAQTLSLIPGTSRSGITMTAARAFGINRQDAARFSMLLSIPTIAGAGLLTVLDVVEAGDPILTQDALIAGGFAALTAFAAIAVLMRWLARQNFTIFALYRLLLGSGLLLFAYFN